MPPRRVPSPADWFSLYLPPSRTLILVNNHHHSGFKGIQVLKFFFKGEKKCEWQIVLLYNQSKIINIYWDEGSTERDPAG